MVKEKKPPRPCPKCGSTTHSRSSSKQCPFYVPPRRKRKQLEAGITDATEQITTRKSALRNMCKDERVYDKIQEDVLEMSGLFVEASIYINYCLYKKWAAGEFPEEAYNFLPYYYELLEGSKEKYAMDKEYKELRRTRYPRRTYEKAYRSNVFVKHAQQYATVFHNNLWIHAYARLRRFMKGFTKDKIIISKTLDALFIRTSNPEPDATLIEAMKEHLDYDGTTPLHDIETKTGYFKHVALFFKLQKYNNEMKLRNFKLMPIFKHGRHHLQYDSLALYQLLSSLGLISGAATDMDNEEWHKWFDIRRVETKRKTFGYSMQTDGVALSLSMSEFTANERRPPKNKKAERKNDKILSKARDLSEIRKKDAANKYEQFIGLDPGSRLVMGGVAMNENSDRRLIKISSKRYHHMAGFGSRKNKLLDWTSDVEEKSKTTLEPHDYEAYTKHRLTHFAERQAVYSKRKIARLKFKKFICTEQACKAVAHEVVADGDNKDRKKYHHRTVVFVGDTEIAANSPIRGYIRTPNRRILRHLQQIADVLRIDEFRTTKLCSECYEPAMTSTTPHRYQFSRKCRIVWHRDVNAGNSILKLGRDHHVRGQDLPKNFRRKTVL